MDAMISAISNCHSVFQLDKLFGSIPAEERINLPVSLVILQESHSPEIREYGMIQALKLTEAQIFNNFAPLLEMKSSISQPARDLVSQLLTRLSQESLVKQFPALIRYLRSDYRFVSDEAERLLNKIEVTSLFSEFDYLERLQHDNYQDVRRVTSNLVVKIMLAWPIETKVANYNEIIKLRHLDKEVGNLLTLQVIETFDLVGKAKYLNCFIHQTCSERVDTSELAASLAFEVLSHADTSLKMEKIQYLTSFHYFGDIKLRRHFRRLALDTIKFFPTSEVHKFFNFLMQCQESKEIEIRRTAWSFLDSIDANQLVIKDLVNWQVAGSKNIQHVAKRLARKITPARLSKKMEYFIDCQKSSDPDVRAFTSELAFLINQAYLFRRIDYLRFYLNDKSINVVYLAQELIDKAEKHASFIDYFFHWVYWRFKFPKA